MRLSLLFARLFFAFLCCALATSYCLSEVTNGSSSLPAMILGVLSGLGISGILAGVDYLLRQFRLKNLALLCLGLLIGCILAQVTWFFLESAFSLSPWGQPGITHLAKVCTYLICSYLGTTLTIRSADELHLSIPFVTLQKQKSSQKKILLSSSALMDARLIDLAATGLMDQQIVIPTFVCQDLYHLTEQRDEQKRARARKALENLKKLEEMKHLMVKYEESSIPPTQDLHESLLQLARQMKAHILTAEVNQLKTSSLEEGVRLINLHSLSNALKPIMQMGEWLGVKVQRYGKEALQGIGYLDDGTMVVINGGGDFIGETIRVKVLSVKHTSSGRMIFCNVMTEGEAPSHRPIASTGQNISPPKPQGALS